MPSGTSARQRQQKLRYINILPTIGFGKFLYICIRITEVNGSGCNNGALAHLARALDWQSKGDRFESDMLHKKSGYRAAFVLSFLAFGKPFPRVCFGAKFLQFPY